MSPIAQSTAVPASPHAGLASLDGRTFPLRSAKLETHASAGVARTLLTQEFSNRYAEPLEVLYTLPLPADGAVVGYSFRLGQRLVTGRIEARSKAQADYRRALAEGRTAGLLEQERSDTFTQSLGNLPPGQDVVVRIEVLQQLAFAPRSGSAQAQWEYRFPTVVGVRYDGAPGRVSDAERLAPPRADDNGTPARLALELRIDDGTPERLAPASPSHALACEAVGSGTRVTLDRDARLDRDVVVTWAAGSGALEPCCVLGGGLDGDGGRYALITLTPPAIAAAVLPRDLTILIDASGSMSGAPLASAKTVAVELLKSLQPDDSFELLAFAMDVRRFAEREVSAEPRAVASAIEFVRALDASGGTEMLGAVRKALTPLRAEAQRQVVLLTDGYIGFESEIVAEVLARLPERSRLHVVGIGAAPCRALTHAVARAGRGLELLVRGEEGATAAATRLVRGTSAPLLTGIAVGGSAVRALAPERPRDVFAGDPLQLVVELASSGGALEVTGQLAGQAALWSARFELDVAAPNDPTLPLGALFGREAVADLEMLAASARVPGAFDERIEQLGLRHRIVTSRTSLVAISEEPSVDPADPRRRERLAVELPADVSAEGLVAPGPWGPGLVACRSVSFVQQHPSAEDPPTGFHLRTSLGVPRPRSTRLRARLVELAGRRLALEFEVPKGGLVLPRAGFEVMLAVHLRPEVRATVVADGSTRAGRVAGGLTVRLALELPEGWSTSARLLTVRWSDRAGNEFTLEVQQDDGPAKERD